MFISLCNYLLYSIIYLFSSPSGMYHVSLFNFFVTFSRYVTGFVFVFNLYVIESSNYFIFF